MGYSGFNKSAFAIWKKRFVEVFDRQPSIEEAFKAGWELQAADNQGYSTEEAMAEFNYGLH